ncbi:sulfurtransferase complex subunit TusD [bacterium]|nr:sulfurtransferase complex subunit TusD [bacterium]
MQFAILITAAPSHQACQSAYRFCHAALANGHSILRLFFYYDSVHIASKLHCQSGNDQVNSSPPWEALIKDHSLDAVVCIAAGLKRGVIDPKEAERFDKPTSNLNDCFELSGLGQLADMIITADRLMTFGG